MVPCLYLFGPLIPNLAPDALVQLARRLRTDPELAPLVKGVSWLSTEWRRLVAGQLPRLVAATAGDQLDALRHLIADARLTTQEVQGPHCLFDSCLTVLLQAVHLCDLDRARGGTILTRTSPTSQTTSFQGLCIGLLSAATAAAASSRADFLGRLPSTLFYAACLGSIVDRDQQTVADPQDRAETFSVRWKASSASVEEVLQQCPHGYISCFFDVSATLTTATVTISQGQSQALLQQLQELGCTIRPVQIGAIFHSQRHAPALQDLRALVDQGPVLETQPLSCHPTRSNFDAACLTRGQAATLLESILVQTADWSKTVTASLSLFGLSSSPEIVSIGPQSCVPRMTVASIAKTMDSTQVDRINGAVNDADNTENGNLGGHDKPCSPLPPYQKIAIIGTGGRFAKANNLAELWDRLCAGQTSLSRVPERRFKDRDLQRAPRAAFWGNFIDDVDGFDNKFFGISPVEAKSMDPQQRMLLEVAYDTLSSAGYFCRPSASKQDMRIGCHIGVGSVDYNANVASHDAGAFSATGTLRAFLSGKLSHHFGWTGPSITYDTACSSSAVAIHSACVALQMGECSEALAGGVNVITDPLLYQNLEAASFLSSTGASKAFDAAADGYCRGEGVGLILLKPLERALADEDDIFGVISGSAVNQGSNCSPITVPDSNSQRDLCLLAMGKGGVSPDDVTYVECHGTGTAVGDPIEYESVHKAFASTARDKPMFIGSVKDSIGHCEGASGVAGVLKVLKMMQHRKIPKQANFRTKSPRIKSFINDFIKIPTETQPWPGSRLKALVNNYGAAGSNAVIVLEELVLTNPPKLMHNPATQATEFPFVIKGKTRESAVSACRSLGAHLSHLLAREIPVNLANLSRRLCAQQNPAHEALWSCVSSSMTDLIGHLNKAITTKSAVPVKPVILFFPGQNGALCHVRQEFLISNPLFKKYLLECELIIEAIGLGRLLPRIFDSAEYTDLAQLHCTIFSVQYSCAMSWIKSGLEVQRMIGHSFGQLTAMCVSGCLSLAEAIRLIAVRARLLEEYLKDETGSMLSIEGDEAQLDQLIAGLAHANEVDVACVNGPRNIVLSGPKCAIAKLQESLAAPVYESSRLRCKPLKNSHAYHSRLIDAIKLPLARHAEKMELSAMQIPIETCTKSSSWESFSASRIVQHSRDTVYFANAVHRIAKRHGACVWIDMGTASPLSAMLSQALGSDASTRQDVLLSVDLGHTNKSGRTVAKAVSQLWEQGHAVQDWSTWGAHAHGPRLDLPLYPFQSSRAWLDLVVPYASGGNRASDAQSLVPAGLLTPLGNPTSSEWSFEVNTTNETFQLCTKGHSVLQKSLCPASMFLELVAEALSHLSPCESQVLHVKHLRMTRPLGLQPSSPVFMHLQKATSQALTWACQLTSQRTICGSSSATSNDGYAATEATVHDASDGRTDVERELTSLQRLITWNRVKNILESTEGDGMKGRFVYKAFAEVVSYAPYFQGITKFTATASEAAGLVKVPPTQINDPRKNWLNPIAVDNFLQVAGIHANCWRQRGTSQVFMCTETHDVYFDKEFLDKVSIESEWLVYACSDTVVGAHEMEYDIFVMSSRSHHLGCALKGVRFHSVNMKSLSRALAGAGSATARILDSLPEMQRSNSHHGILTSASPKAPVGEQPRGDKSHHQTFSDVQALLVEIMDIEADQVHWEVHLTSLGVDSLMVNELKREILKRFKRDIPMDFFQDSTTIRHLIDEILPLEKPQHEENDRPDRKDDDGRLVMPTSALPPASISQVNLAGEAQAIFHNYKSSIDGFMRATGFSGFYDNVYPMQAELVTRYITDAFAHLHNPLDKMSAGQVLEPLDCASQHRNLAKQLHLVLVDAGLLSMDQRGFEQHFRRTSKPVPETDANTLNGEILGKFPQNTLEHRLLHVTGPFLADCLTGKTDPISLLFGDAETRTLLSDVYANAPMFMAGTMLLAQFLEHLFTTVGRGKEIYILEIGAGTGGTTSLLLEMLARLKQTIIYTFTDLSSSLLIAAQKKFRAYPFMQFRTLNAEAEPPADLLGKYHVAISTNCIHATTSLVQSATHIRKMLRPDGILCLVELTRNLYWFDLVFGLLEGWWLFNDGRQHALASERHWEEALKQAGFNWVEWSQGASDESNVLRVIAASPSHRHDGARAVVTDEAKPKTPPRVGAPTKTTAVETFCYKQIDGLKLLADVHYPPETASDGDRPSPVALMIHGGGHVLLSRKSFATKQIDLLLCAGFVAVSIDYRLCPETILTEGAMTDVLDALTWIRTCLPNLAHPSAIQPDCERVVAAGWSTGGHLAMTLAWTTLAAGVLPPKAVLALYCPVDYEDPFWRRPNIPRGTQDAARTLHYDLARGTYSRPVESHVLADTAAPVDGWMAPDDARSRILLHMNWHGQTLHVLLHGMDAIRAQQAGLDVASCIPVQDEQVQEISPLAQVRRGRYKTPTCLIHGTEDDLVPVQQAQRMYEALQDAAIEGELHIAEDAPHLFDVFYAVKRPEWQAVVQKGIEFLRRFV